MVSPVVTLASDTRVRRDIAARSVASPSEEPLLHVEHTALSAGADSAWEDGGGVPMETEMELPRVAQETTASEPAPAMRRTYRTVELSNSATTAELLADEPYRPGPPSSGPGVSWNRVITSQYTLMNFLPKNLFHQFHRSTNCYFLLVSCMQMISAITISSGNPTVAVPLMGVLVMTAVKDALEDYSRHQADDIENSRLTVRLDSNNRAEQAEIATAEVRKDHLEATFVPWFVTRRFGSRRQKSET